MVKIPEASSVRGWIDTQKQIKDVFSKNRLPCRHRRYTQVPFRDVNLRLRFDSPEKGKGKKKRIVKTVTIRLRSIHETTVSMFPIPRSPVTSPRTPESITRLMYLRVYDSRHTSCKFVPWYSFTYTQVHWLSEHHPPVSD